MRLCEHDEIAYEVSTRTVRPFHWKIHTLRCTACGTKAIVVNREEARR